MWFPLKLERVTLATRLSPDECRARLAHTTSHLLEFLHPSLLPVHGFVYSRTFYLGRCANTRAWLRTWISGQIRRVEQKTVIEVAIGPNRVAGIFFTVLAAMLGAGAILATMLAFTTPFETWRGAVLSWIVVGAFIAVFFVFPATDHEGERAFLLDHVQRTLEATEQKQRRA